MSLREQTAEVKEQIIVDQEENREENEKKIAKKNTPAN